MRKVPALLTAAIVAGALAVSASAQAATTLSASWNESCGKSTCFNDSGVFTQSFSAKDFSGPVNVGQLLLQRGVLGAMEGSTFQLSFALNGETLGTWGQYTMAGIGGDWLTFGGEGFTWNPEDGDLVLVLALVPPPKAGAGGGFFARSGPSDERGAEQQDVFFGGSGLEAMLPVPEPGAWALMISGFGLTGAALRQRRRLAVA